MGTPERGFQIWTPSREGGRLQLKIPRSCVLAKGSPKSRSFAGASLIYRLVLPLKVTVDVVISLEGENLMKLFSLKRRLASARLMPVALLGEPGKHPVQAALLSTFCRSSLGFNVRMKWVQRFLARSPEGEPIFDFGLAKLPYLDDPSYLHEVVYQYFDFIYPVTVRHPLPTLIQEGAYETGPVTIREGDTVIDLGANIGFFAILAAQKARLVYAFEPVPPTVDLLVSAVKLNHLKNVTVVRQAVGQQNGFLELRFGDFSSTASAVLPRRGDTLTVPMTTVDNFVECTNVDRVDL